MESMESGRPSMIVFGCEASRQRLADDSLGASPPSLSIFTLGSLAAFSFPVVARFRARFFVPVLCGCEVLLPLACQGEEGALDGSQMCSVLLVALLRVRLAPLLSRGLIRSVAICHFRSTIDL